MTFEFVEFGEKDGAHALLRSTLPASGVPRTLAGAVDRPTGVTLEEMPPDGTFGVGPFGEWMALWVTQPDLKAARSGMVRSTALLATHDQLALEGGFLTAVTALLARVELPVPVADHGAPNIPEAQLIALVRGDGPIVAHSAALLVAWTVRLWARLWPGARRQFAARCIAAPSGLVGNEWVVHVPQSHRPKWRAVATEAPASDREDILTAVRWLMEGPSFEAAALASRLPDLPGDARQLVRLARVARSSEALAKGTLLGLPLVQFARDLAELPGVGTALPTECGRCLAALSVALPGVNPAVVLGLSNVAISRLGDVEPVVRAVRGWVQASLSGPRGEPLVLATRRAFDAGYVSWWQEAVRAALVAEFSRPSENLGRFCWELWGSEPSTAAAFLAAAPAAKPLQEVLLSTLPAALSDAVNEAALDISRRRGWSRLNAAVLLTKLPVERAVQEQSSFSAAPEEGLDLIAERYPLDAADALARLAPGMGATALARCLRQRPEVRAKLDLGSETWRRALHVVVNDRAVSGCQWRTLSAQVLLRWPVWAPGDAELCERILLLDPPSILDFQERSTWWSRIPSRALAPVLTATAEAWLRGELDGAEVEMPLRASILALFRTSTEPVGLGRLIQFVAALRELTEDDFIRRLTGVHGTATEAVAWGHVLLTRRWERAVRATLEQYRRGASWLRPALEQASSLLSVWERLGAGLYFGGSMGLTGSDLSDVFAELYPGGIADRGVWDRAGGKSANVEFATTPRAQWQKAVSLAERGGLKGGTRELVREALLDFPDNRTLQDLARSLGLVTDSREHSRREK